jgi:hypothetical protein
MKARLKWLVAVASFVSVSAFASTENYSAVEDVEISSERPSLSNRWEFVPLVGTEIATNGNGAGLSYGVAIDNRINENFSVGTFFMTATRQGPNGIEATISKTGPISESFFSASSRSYFYGLEGHYHFAAIEGLGLGAAFGGSMEKFSWDLSEDGRMGMSGSTSTRVSYGPKIVYDFNQNSSWSLGLRADLLFSHGGEAVSHVMASVRF